MNPDSWILELLRSRNLERPDGRMLYGYRLTDLEYQTLRDRLSYASSVGRLDEISIRMRGFSALFVIYASEWWRREYQGGAWRWSSIVSSFYDGLEPFDAGARTRCVTSGFAFWGHRPRGEGKKYFGSIVAHGGLPLKFIAQGGGKIASIMGHTLRLASRYGWDEAQMIESVADHAGELPDSLQRIEIYELISNMIASVLEVKQEFKLSGVADPIALLNEQCSGWRERFPLPLDDEAAQVLLYGLVKEASLLSTIRPSAIFSVERFLRKLSNDTYELASTVFCPKSIETDVLTSSFGIGQREALPRFFKIDAQVIDRVPLADGRQIMGAQIPSVSFSLRNQVWKNHEACAEHMLILSSQHGELHDSPISIPGGNELYLEEPWIFVLRDGKNTLAATGGARIPEEDALIALPEGWTIDVSEGSRSTSAGTCVISNLLKPLFLVSGVVDLIKEDVRYQVRTRQTTGNPDSYAWEGRRALFPSNPSAIYHGTPKLYRYTSEGERSRVNPAAMKWFVAGTSNAIEGPNARGPVDVYLTNDGERLTRFRLVIIDPSAQTRFFSGDTSSDGRILLEGWGCSNISISQTPELNVALSQVGTAFDLKMRAGDVPPEDVNICMYWARSTKDVTLKLPFPCAGGRFFDAHGNPLSDGHVLTLQQLTGARLRVFDRNPQQPKKYEIVLTLRGSQLKETKSIELKTDGSAEIRLIDLQEDVETLMGFSDMLDAIIDVALSVGGNRSSSILLSRYECNVEHQQNGICLSNSVLRDIGANKLQNIQVRAAPITSIVSESSQITQELSEGAPTGSWRLDTLDSAKSPWLIYPDETSSVFFRPTIWVNEASEAERSATASCILANAMKIGHRQQREDAIASVLTEMAVDFGHDSWALLDHLWSEFRHLPLTSLDVFRILGPKTEAVIAMMLRSQLPEQQLLELSRRLRDELGLVWELTSIPMWRNAVKFFWKYWQSLTNIEVAAARAIFDIVLSNRLHALSRHIPSLTLVLDLIIYEVTGKKSDELEALWDEAEEDQLAAAKRLWVGGNSLGNNLLFVAHAHDEWPAREDTGKFFESAWEGFVTATDEHTQNIIGPIANLLFWIKPGDFKLPVANAPVLCALWAATGAGQEWWSVPKRRLDLRKLWAFDPIWFERAFRQAMVACLSLDDLVEPTLLINDDGTV